MGGSLGINIADMYGYRCAYPYEHYGTRFSGDNNPLYLEVPIKEDVIEIPTMLYPSFMREVCLKDIPDVADFLVAKLHPGTGTCHYKTPESVFKDLIGVHFERNRLIKYNFKDTIYYFTNGAIFNENIKPLLMASWKIKYIPSEANEIARYHFRFLQPILRIDPSCFEQEDALQKFIVGKLVRTTLNCAIDIPGSNIAGVPRFRVDATVKSNAYRYTKVQIEIAECPFNIRRREPPTIATTSKVLRDIADACLKDVINDNQ